MLSEAELKKLKELVLSFLEKRKITLVDFSFQRLKGEIFQLRLLVDLENGGITLEECAQLNREIGEILDQEDFIKNSYLLEVSSPGLDRPLKTKADFLRSLNKKVRFLLYEPVEGKREWWGEVKEVQEEAILLMVENKKVIQLPLVKIQKGMFLI